MKKCIFILLMALSAPIYGKGVITTDTVSFVFESKKLTGLLDQPKNKRSKALILLIPGSGKTNMVEGNGYYRKLRQFFAEEGFACYVWDKQGCGKSEGLYDDSKIQNSADEAIAAIKELQRLNIPGSDKIGLWGLSRGGWVCPLIIKDYPSITFWISVSGPDSEENFGYLLERNLLIEGRSKEQTHVLMKAWHDNLDIARHGGTFEENQKAMDILRNDSFYRFICGNSPKPTKEKYIVWQQSLMSGQNLPVNEKTGLQIYYSGLAKDLSNINCPVLAIFGEKDSQVDWRKTKTLYEGNIGRRNLAKLTIKTFADGNHNLFKCKTGGFLEKMDKYEFCDGYLETMAAWLKTNVLGL